MKGEHIYPKARQTPSQQNKTATAAAAIRPKNNNKTTKGKGDTIGDTNTQK